MYYINTKKIGAHDFIKKYDFVTDPQHVNEDVLPDNIKPGLVYLDAISLADGQIVPMLGVRLIDSEFLGHDNNNQTYFHFTAYQLVPSHITSIDLEKFRSIVFEMIKSGDIILG